MNFSAKHDIDAPIEHVFAHVSDFAAFERMAMRRGARVTRQDNLTEPGPGMIWHLAFSFRGRDRALDLTLEEFERPSHMTFAGASPGIEGGGKVELMALSPTRTRLKLKFEIKPKTLSARLLVQSMKLAKGNIENRLQTRLVSYSSDIASSYKKSA